MISKRFEDFDAFAATIRDVDCEMLLRNPQRHLWEIDQTNVAGIDVQLGKVGSGNIVQGQSWSNGFLFYVPLTAAVEYSANGIVIGENSVAVLEPGCDFCVSTKIAHDWCTVFVPTRMLVCESEAPASSSAPIIAPAKRCYVPSVNSHVADWMVAAVRQILFASKNSSKFENSPAAASAVVELSKIATTLVQQGRLEQSPQEGRPVIHRKEIIDRSMSILEERSDENITVKEIASAAHVSERTLRSAFNEYFGLSPIRYLQLRRLNRVKQSLRSASRAHVSVADILVDHGVFEFGRFASQYRQLFGELPSETLKNSSFAR
jgi:AraC family ethanolamine operon transcriptional activator